MLKNRKSLFVSYNSATEPLVRSQVLPYISALSERGVEFSFLSYEKDPSEGNEIAAFLKKVDIRWMRLAFHNKPLFLAKLFDIKIGGMVVFWTCLTKRIDIVHARGIMGACISFIPARLCGAKFIFDMKSSLAEAYRLNGRLKKESFAYKTIAWLERFCVLNSDEVVVETTTHKEELEAMMVCRKRRPHLTVLPCCVDVHRFKDNSKHKYLMSNGGLRLVYLGSLSGWYMIPEMLDFFKEVKMLYPASEFLFLTDDPDGKVKMIAEQKRLEGIIVTKVRYEDVPKSLWGSSAGVLFKWSNERLDSFPIKVAEYLAAGLPLIINAGMGDVEDIVVGDKVGVVVKYCERASYSKAAHELCQIIKDGPYLQKRCEDVAVSQLSSDFAFSQYHSIYNRLIS